MSTRESAFAILWRTFLDQFVANESATSDLQMRRAIENSRYGQGIT